MTSLLFKTATRLILPLSLLFAAFMSFKGHNAPGGGFIGGLIASVALWLFAMAHGRDALIALVPVHPRVVVGFGLLIALATAALPLLWGYPLLHSFAIDNFLGLGLHLVTAFFFDFGVMLVVIGVSTGMIQRLSEEVPDESTGLEGDLA